MVLIYVLDMSCANININIFNVPALRDYNHIQHLILNPVIDNLTLTNQLLSPVNHRLEKHQTFQCILINK